MTSDRDVADGFSSVAKKITNRIWLSEDQARTLARDIDLALASVREEEREACAKIAAEKKTCRSDQPDTHDGMWATYGYQGQQIARRIRSRQTPTGTENRR